MEIGNAAAVKMILTDVDGVMTDGKIIYDDRGTETKEFNARDGFGIRLWCKNGGLFGIVTGRSSRIVKMRADELGAAILRQGVTDKAEAVRQIAEMFKIGLNEIAFIGDDYPDLRAMRIVGFPAAVADAAEEIRGAAVWVSNQPGGKGAVRELVETILQAENLWDSALQFYRS